MIQAGSAATRHFRIERSTLGCHELGITEVPEDAPNHHLSALTRYRLTPSEPVHCGFLRLVTCGKIRFL